MCEIREKLLAALSTNGSIFLDFDGVLTDDRVWVDAIGNESVVCNRRDGLAFDWVRLLNFRVFVVSTEKNPVVVSRCKKLQLQCYNGVENKKAFIEELADKENISLVASVYIGNDLNDYSAMNLCGFKICPSDSHHEIKKISDIVLSAKGGRGVMREFVEEVMGINIFILQEFLSDKNNR